MKKWITVLLIAGFATAAQAQNTPDSKSAVPEVLALKETSFDFGKIGQGRPVTHVFEVTNTGKEVMRLDNVQASCGCTTPEWSREPIQPGATASIKVGYNAAAEGPFNKTVTIVYNNNQTKTIVISGNVYKAPATSAPANASLSLLKQ
ncbi:DUF1573 domain-containing protein [Paraflavitalea soli]|uniref:DUF1573 domain-containing protein n=1 Tax=Paraflavitalea soli TaxID=2315862 RepID=A0A3B7MQ94_9BACT|nr:DUF1573 domain-containing protein [Paraflavitalea soli]AXY75499.1 DUF1573 domain-containing protein [Paraflavitalea soli]